MTHHLRLAVVLTVVTAPAVQGQVRLEDRFFDSNGVRIRYVDVGRGEPVVLVHSMSDSVEMWRDRGIIDALAADYRVVVLDLRGHGRSEKPHDLARYGLEMVHDVARLLDHLQIPRAHLVGYSMGGYVVGRFAASFPERVLTATFGGSSVMSAGLWQARFEDRVPSIADALERGDPRLLLARVAEPHEMEDRVRDSLDRNDARAIAAAVRTFGATTLTGQEIAALSMPLLVVVGSEDLPESRIEAFKGLQPAPKMVIIDAATHGGPRGTLRRPEFVRTLRDFLTAHRVSVQSVR